MTADSINNHDNEFVNTGERTRRAFNSHKDSILRADNTYNQL